MPKRRSSSKKKSRGGGTAATTTHPHNTPAPAPAGADPFGGDFVDSFGPDDPIPERWTAAVHAGHAVKVCADGAAVPCRARSSSCD